MPLIGAHVSASGSLDLSLDRAHDIGAQATQIFITPPQQWATKEYPEQQIINYKTKSQELKIAPNFIHAVYLINLATSTPENLTKGIDWLIYSQNMAQKLGISGTIFHIGSYKDREQETALDQVADSISKVLKAVPGIDLILENSAGAGNNIGKSFEQIGQIFQKINDPHLKVCLDTQHAFASGYDLRTKDAVTETISKFDSIVGLDKLVAIHANDSKVELGSNKDRHENIGAGFIGKDGFSALINHPALKNIPFILEVPGFEGGGPDKKNIELLKSLIN